MATFEEIRAQTPVQNPVTAPVPLPLDDTADAFVYTGKEELQQQKYLPGYNRFLAGLFSAAATPGGAIIDFGSGIGTIAALVREQTGCTRFVCVELDHENAQVLQSKGFAVVSDAAYCPESSIDLVYSSNVLEHIEDDVAALRAMHRVLKPGGRGVFWVPAFPCLWTPFDTRIGHFRRYRRQQMIQSCQAAGLQVETCVYQDSVGFFVALLFKYLNPNATTVSNWSLATFDRFLFPISRLMDRFCSGLFGKNVLVYVRK
jgi:SAM-dependent methyltransferase